MITQAAAHSEAFLKPQFLTRRTLFSYCVGGLAASQVALGEDDGFRGVFPIVATPYSDDGSVDLETLADEVRFLDLAGVHGIVWPQLASEYALLTFDERIAGAEAIVEASKGLRPKVVIGVQADNTETAVRYAQHAKSIGPDAIIALPSRKGGQSTFDLQAVSGYYRAVAEAGGLPMFMQAIGNMSVGFVSRMVREIPNLRFVKDEAGHTLSRLTEFQQLSAAERPVAFTGGHGRTLIEEMARGSAGNMPAASWVDLYVRVWELWHAGHRNEAIDMFSKTLLLITKAQAHGLPALSYVLHLRGVFPNWRVRSPNARLLDEQAKASLQETLEFVRPYLRT
ncbi:MAG: dihydrodipicolinate synthase family protein [Bryobacterales bacterium]|nr:dihydrodipicolinate synthase family protein [Bryobacterales bacterium]